MKYINYSFSDHELVKGTFDNVYEGEHNATTLCIAIEGIEDFAERDFTLKFHTADCKRYRFTVDKTIEGTRIEFLIPSIICVAGPLEFDLDSSRKMENSNELELEHIATGSFLVLESIGNAEEGDPQFIDLMTVFEEKYRKAKDELTNLLQNVIINLLQDASTDLAEMMADTQSQIDDAVSNMKPRMVNMFGTLQTKLENSLRAELLSEFESGKYDGVTPTVTIGRITTIEAGKDATVVNSGTATDIVLDFEFPESPKVPYSFERKAEGFPVRLPDNAVFGNFGGLHMNFTGETVVDGDFVFAKNIISVTDKNGKFKGSVITPNVGSWDILEIYKEGEEILPSDKYNCMCLLEGTMSGDVKYISGWTKYTGDGYVDFYHTSFSVSANIQDSLPRVKAVSYPTIASNGLPDENSWAITSSHNSCVTFRYNGSFVGDADDFIAEITSENSHFIYAKPRNRIPYTFDIDLCAGDTIELLPYKDNPSLDGSINFLALGGDNGLCNEFCGFDKESKIFTVTKKGVKIPENIGEKYVKVGSDFNIICRSRNIFTPLYYDVNDQVARSSKKIFVVPNTKYYLGIYGNVVKENITVNEYSSSGTVVKISTLSDFAFTTTENTAYLTFDVDVSLGNLEYSEITLSSNGVLPQGSVYREFCVTQFEESGKTAYRIGLIAGGELISKSNSSYNVEIPIIKSFKEAVLCETFYAGEINPYGTVKKGENKFTAFGSTNDNGEHFSGRVVVHGGKNQYDPYVERVGASSSFQNRSFAENLGNGWIRAYNTDYDSLNISDVGFISLLPNKIYSMCIDIIPKLGTINFAVWIRNSSNQNIATKTITKNENYYSFSFTVPDDGLVKFLFLPNLSASPKKDVEFRPMLVLGQGEVPYEEYKVPEVIKIPELKEGESRILDSSGIYLEPNGFCEVISDNSAMGRVEISCETKFRNIATDKLKSTVATYSRSIDKNGFPLEGIRHYKFIAVRDNQSKVTERYISHTKNSISEAASAGVGNTMVTDDIIYIFGR